MDKLKNNACIVKINGDYIEIENVSTVEQMLKARNFNETMFVVERNQQILPKEMYSQTRVKNGDTFEIVGFFGGG